jgi:hypothetical protein
VILLLVNGILFAIDTFTLKQQFSKSTAVFSGKAVRPTYTVPGTWQWIADGAELLRKCSDKIIEIRKNIELSY